MVTLISQTAISEQRSIYFDAVNAMLTRDTVAKEQTDLDADFIILASVDPSSDDDDQSDENDVFNVSCHGNHFKRMKEEPKQCDEFTIKRRKVHTQLDLMNSALMTMKFGDDPSVASVSLNKRQLTRKVLNKRLARKAKD